MISVYSMPKAGQGWLIQQLTDVGKPEFFPVLCFVILSVNLTLKWLQWLSVSYLDMATPSRYISLQFSLSSKGHLSQKHPLPYPRTLPFSFHWANQHPSQKKQDHPSSFRYNWPPLSSTNKNKIRVLLGGKKGWIDAGQSTNNVH